QGGHVAGFATRRDRIHTYVVGRQILPAERIFRGRSLFFRAFRRIGGRRTSDDGEGYDEQSKLRRQRHWGLSRGLWRGVRDLRRRPAFLRGPESSPSSRDHPVGFAVTTMRSRFETTTPPGFSTV